MNAGSWLYYEGMCQLLNWRYVSAPIVFHLSGGRQITGTAAYDRGDLFDSNGHLATPIPNDVVSFQMVVLAGPQQPVGNPGGDFRGERFTMTSFGTGCTVSVSTGASATSGTSFNFHWICDGGPVTVLFTVIDRNSPPRNIFIYQDRYAANVANGETWNPDWLNEYKQWGCGRHLNSMSINNCWITDYSQFADFDYFVLGGYFGQLYNEFTGPIPHCDIGPKGSIHPNVLCSLANAAGKPIYVHIPLHATDKCVALFAAAMKAGTDQTVIYEFSNECWNGGFYQYRECVAAGKTLGLWRPEDPAIGFKYYGYRAAEVMKIIRDIYGSSNRSRWQGALGTQAVGYGGVTSYNISGAQKYLSSVGLKISDVFNDLYIAPYIGITLPAVAMSSVIKNKTTNLKFEGADVRYVLDPANGNVANEQAVQVYLHFDPNQSAWAARSGVYTAVMNKSDTITIADLDSSSFPAFSADTRSYMASSGIFNLVFRSISLSRSNPTRYPTTSQYFNEQMQQLITRGSCTFGLDFGTISLAFYVSTVFPAQLSNAQNIGIGLACYELGNTMSEDGTMAGYGGDRIVTGPLMDFAVSRECAEAVGALMQAAITAGCSGTCKFANEGYISQFGPWNIYRWGPLVANRGVEDTSNPVYLRCQTANSGLRELKMTS
jgi:hypothetical protein